jgi:hypothetical protein
LCPVRIRDFLGPGFIEIHHRIGKTMTGLGYHGHIALVVFVKEWLPQAGICECSKAVRSSVSLGRNLVLTRASNKARAVVHAAECSQFDAAVFCRVESQSRCLSCCRLKQEISKFTRRSRLLRAIWPLI